MSDKKPGDGAYNRRRPFKRLSEMDKIRLLNAETRHLQAEDQRTTKELNEAADRLKRGTDKANSQIRSKNKLLKSLKQETNRLSKLKKGSGGRAGIAGAVGYALADKYLTPLAKKAGAKLGNWMKSKVKPGTTHPKKKDYVMGNNGNWVKRTAYKSKK
tara:strand:+ start:65 stop:538 length:474 start_codon:yes stop_codon:yes gene_type:complete